MILVRNKLLLRLWKQFYLILQTHHILHSSLWIIPFTTIGDNLRVMIRELGLCVCVCVHMQSVACILVCMCVCRYTFTNICSASACVHLYREIIEWSKAENRIETCPRLDNFSSVDMSTAKFEDLSLRIGYPYLFCHHNTCEHLMVFTDLRYSTCLYMLSVGIY